MKKRLLITSIVMMLVVAVALSTATYAWFTSSAQVTSSSISLTAASNSAASLGISWDNITYGTSITATSPVTSGENIDYFNPACPATLGESTTSDVDFYTASATPYGGDMIFKSDTIATTDVYTWADGTGASAHKSFFIKNLSPANSISAITIKATINETNSNSIATNLVRVGIFKKDANSGDYLLLGVLANQDTTGYVAFTGTFSSEGTYYKKNLGKYVLATAGTADEVAAGTKDYTNETTAPAGKFFTATGTAAPAQVVYGTIGQSASVNAQTSKASTPAGTGLDITEGNGLAANGVIELVVLVWEDAVALGDAEYGTVSTVALTFDAA